MRQFSFGFLLGSSPEIVILRSMPNSADALRRWCGLLFLLLAFGLLIWGQTVLRDSLHGVAFFIYWFFCFLFTFAAIITALLDVRATRKRARKEQEELVARTLREIEREVQNGSKTNGGGPCREPRVATRSQSGNASPLFDFDRGFDRVPLARIAKLLKSQENPLLRRGPVFAPRSPAETEFLGRSNPLTPTPVADRHCEETEKSREPDLKSFLSRCETRTLFTHDTRQQPDAGCGNGVSRAKQPVLVPACSSMSGRALAVPFGDVAARDSPHCLKRERTT